MCSLKCRMLAVLMRDSGTNGGGMDKEGRTDEGGDTNDGSSTDEGSSTDKGGRHRRSMDERGGTNEGGTPGGSGLMKQMPVASISSGLLTTYKYADQS